PSLSISPFTRSLSPPHFVSFHHPATAEICTLSLHDALPIYSLSVVNARYGLQAGDKFTAEFANLMKNTFRGSDTLARYSGNHFLVIMPGTGEQQAEIAVRRFQEAVDQWNLATKTGWEINVVPGISPHVTGCDAG